MSWETSIGEGRVKSECKFSERGMTSDERCSHEEDNVSGEGEGVFGGSEDEESNEKNVHSAERSEEEGTERKLFGESEEEAGKSGSRSEQHSMKNHADEYLRVEDGNAMHIGNVRCELERRGFVPPNALSHMTRHRPLKDSEGPSFHMPKAGGKGEKRPGIPLWKRSLERPLSFRLIRTRSEENRRGEKKRIRLERDRKEERVDSRLRDTSQQRRKRGRSPIRGEREGERERVCFRARKAYGGREERKGDIGTPGDSRAIDRPMEAGTRLNPMGPPHQAISKTVLGERRNHPPPAIGKERRAMPKGGRYGPVGGRVVQNQANISGRCRSTEVPRKVTAQVRNKQPKIKTVQQRRARCPEL